MKLHGDYISLLLGERPSVRSRAYRSCLLHRPDMNVGHFGGLWQAERAYYDRGDILALQQKLRSIGFPLHAVYALLHLARGSSEIHAQHPNAVRVDLRAQTVSDGPKRMLG